MKYLSHLTYIIIIASVCRIEPGYSAYLPATGITPPPPNREFRGVWIATINNIDWPSKPGLPVEQQKSELIKLLDLAKNLKLNVIIFQVRPACDAMYASRIEPWSEYLTGEMGVPPTPFYDPLAFAIEEAHKRGLELHAWFNPFRARHPSAFSKPDIMHISSRRPTYLKSYGKHLWLDPGDKNAREYTISVIMDVVKRYDIDGVHLDDYFYPYVEKDASGKDIPFPDDDTYNKYRKAGGTLSKNDWRRENINQFVKNLYNAIHSEKKWVKLGISPFGIWRPNHPPQILGMDAYERIYADSLKWLQEGWVDYFAPQLYWGINEKNQSFPILLEWWAKQNVKHRLLCPGINTRKTARQWQPQEIINQVLITRNQVGVLGHIHWSIGALAQNNSTLTTQLMTSIYEEQAVAPAYIWLDQNRPARPRVYIGSNTKGDHLTLKIETVEPQKIWLWCVQTKIGNKWRCEFYPSNKPMINLRNSQSAEAIAVSAINRYGIASAAVVFARK